MSLLSKRAHLECCECGRCRTGCCIPVDHSNPIYEPHGTPMNVPFSISAPGCPDIDGFEGEMLCGGAQPAILGPCGPCVSCFGGFQQLLPGSFWTPNPFFCFEDTCSIRVCLALRCQNTSDSGGDFERCCKKFRLMIGCSAPIVDEDVRLRQNIQGCEYWKLVEPTSCVCNPDPEGFPAIVFPLGVEIYCEAGVYESGVCIGRSRCCEFATCSFAGAEVII